MKQPSSCAGISEPQAAACCSSACRRPPHVKFRIDHGAHDSITHIEYARPFLEKGHAFLVCVQISTLPRLDVSVTAACQHRPAALQERQLRRRRLHLCKSKHTQYTFSIAQHDV